MDYFASKVNLDEYFFFRSKHPRNCKLKGRAVYTGSSDDSPMITDDDCLSSVYDPDDDNRRTDDDEDEFQSIENVSLPILN